MSEAINPKYTIDNVTGRTTVAKKSQCFLRKVTILDVFFTELSIASTSEGAATIRSLF